MTLAPSWLLMLWAGAAAFLLTATFMGAIPASHTPATRVLCFQPRGTRDSLTTAALGVLLYPLMYCLIFDLIHAANVFSGAGLGLLHAAVCLTLRARDRPYPAPRTLLAALVTYGILLGWLYATP
jgi:hypothetical protein